MMSMMSRSQSYGRSMYRSCFCMLFVAVLCGFAASQAAAKYDGGSGTQANPYLIRTAEDLVLLGSSPADWDSHFKMVADIDLKGYNEKNFPLIGYWVSWGDPGNRPFGGSFDGDGRTISNFTYNGGKQDKIALFRYVGIAEVKNVRLVNAKVISDGQGVAALVGYVKNGAVDNCQATGIDVTGNVRVGGLIGECEGLVARCSTRGRVIGVQYVGGLIGSIGDGTVSTSYSKATVSGNESVGGLVGATLNQESIIDGCYATGSVSGSTYVGGLAGQVVQGRLHRSYSAGAVHGTTYVGGLVGSTRVLGQVIVSYWDVDASGQATSGGGEPKTTTEMRSWETFSGWDFQTTWTICEGNGYPVFWWQILPADMHCPDGVNAMDFAWFALQWRRQGCVTANSHCEWADFDESGSVGFSDLAILARDWLAGTD
jgi:hypothetical protein